MWWILLQELWVHSAVGPAPSGLRSGVPLGSGSEADMTLNFQSYMFDFKSLSLCRVGHLSCKKGEMDHEFCRFEWLEITFLGGRVIQNIFSYIIWLVRGNKHKGNIISGEQLGPWPQDSRHWVEGKGQRLPSGRPDGSAKYGGDLMFSQDLTTPGAPAAWTSYQAFPARWWVHRTPCLSGNNDAKCLGLQSISLPAFVSVRIILQLYFKWCAKSWKTFS